MAFYVFRRVAQGVVVVAGVVLIVFLATRTLGDPVDFLLPTEATREQRDELTALLGLDRPVASQLGDYVGNVARLDLGESLVQRRAATEIIIERLPRTLQLVACGLGLAVVLAVPIGVIAARRAGRSLDQLLVTVSLLGLSMPQFWLGLVLILVFSVEFGWLPSANTGTWQHLVLPSVTLALPATGRLAMIVRSSMIDELNQPYIRTARAKGLSRRSVIWLHALRNASVPLVTLLGWELIRALAGYTIVVERVFEWPGLGRAAFEAIEGRDLPLLQAVVLVVAVMVVVVNIGIDIAYRALNPKIEVT